MQCSSALGFDHSKECGHTTKNTHPTFGLSRSHLYTEQLIEDYRWKNLAAA